MYLLDTSIILELLLDQRKADEVERFLRNTPPEHLYLSEFALYSLGIILLRHGMHAIFLQLVEDLLMTGAIGVARLGLEDMGDVVHAARRFDLDFDDAYQYAAAEKYNLAILSFDDDFDRTERGRDPARVIVLTDISNGNRIAVEAMSVGPNELVLLTGVPHANPSAAEEL